MKRFNITVNGTAYDVTVDEVGGASTPAAAPAPAAPAPAAPAPAAAAPAAAPAPAPAKPAGPVAGTKLSSPMPGNILDVVVKVGDAVKKGQKLIVLEAMKMENDINAPCDGTVASIDVRKGDTVNTGDTLAVIG